MKVGQKMKSIEIEPSMKQRKLGRPRAISDDLVPLVLSLYEDGFGYRAIAHKQEKDGVFAEWSTVRRLIKKWKQDKSHANGPCSDCDTILTRATSKD